MNLGSLNSQSFVNYKTFPLIRSIPRCPKHRISCLESLKPHNFSLPDVGLLRLAKRGVSVRAKSVLEVDKVVKLRKGNSEYNAIVIGSGIGGLVAATQLAVNGVKVLALEKYVIPGGSSGFYEREGYTFDVGSSVMFGFSDKDDLPKAGRAPRLGGAVVPASI